MTLRYKAVSTANINNALLDAIISARKIKEPVITIIDDIWMYVTPATNLYKELDIYNQKLHLKHQLQQARKMRIH